MYRCQVRHIPLHGASARGACANAANALLEAGLYICVSMGSIQYQELPPGKRQPRGAGLGMQIPQEGRMEFGVL